MNLLAGSQYLWPALVIGCACLRPESEQIFVYEVAELRWQIQESECCVSVGLMEPLDVVCFELPFLRHFSSLRLAEGAKFFDSAVLVIEWSSLLTRHDVAWRSCGSEYAVIEHSYYRLLDGKNCVCRDESTVKFAFDS